MPICHKCCGFYKPSERGQQICDKCKLEMLKEMQDREERAEENIKAKDLDK
jgi:hypothetical protein